MIAIPRLHNPGAITVQELPPKTLGDSSEREMPTVQVSRYDWSPPSSLDLPAGFQLSLSSFTGADGYRRFWPTRCANPLILKASLAGHALLRNCEQLDEKQSFSYHALRLIYQHSARQRETFNRRFRRATDLRVTRSVQSDGNADILPDTIGVDLNGDGQRWSVSELWRTAVRRSSQVIRQKTRLSLLQWLKQRNAILSM